MNPEEGSLRPQLLDRFGLCVQLRNLEDRAERQAVVRARLAFDSDPEGFRARHAAAEAELAASLRRARATLADATALPYGDAVHEAVGALCIAAQVDGLRADLVMLRAGARAGRARRGGGHRRAACAARGRGRAAASTQAGRGGGAVRAVVERATALGRRGRERHR